MQMIGFSKKTPPGPPAYYVQDFFADANNTLLTAHVPDYDHVGGGWSKIYGTNVPTIKSANNRVEGGATDTTLMVIDSGVSDCQVDIRVYFTSIFQTGYSVSRFVDSSNYWRMRRNPAGHTCDLQEITGGSLTIRGSTYTSGGGTAGYWGRFSHRLDGNSMLWRYSAQDNGTWNRQYSYTSSTHNTATKHGFITTGSAPYWDDFEVKPL
jgi:hypothetical protein